MHLASVDGAIGPAGDATIPVTDDGLLRGDGAFEVVRLYRGRPFALEEHMSRLQNTCLGLHLEADVEVVRSEIEKLLREAGDVEGLLRVVLTRGGVRILIVEPLPAHAESARVATVTYEPTRVLDGLKTLSYAANMLAGRLARERGADEALFVTPGGRVLEGPTWTFFWVQDSQLLTPPLSERILASITRAFLIEEAGALERTCTLDMLETAEEAFIASSLRECLPIAAIDDRPFALPGPVTDAARAALMARIERELAAAAA